MTKLMPKNSIITGSELTGNAYHVLTFHYHPDNKMFVADKKHLMGECRHCKKFIGVKK